MNHLKLLLCFSLFSCSPKNEQKAGSVNHSNDSTNSAQSLPRTDLKRITTFFHLDVNKDTLNFGDTLILKLKTPHGKELSLMGPDYTSRLVIFSAERDDLQKKPFMDSKEFRLSDSIFFETASDSSFNYATGQLEPLFIDQGVYRIFVGDNLESDALGRQIDFVDIYFTGRK